ncbi:MAG: 23S rRNA (adenine(2503)-C(2))-methyltransferase RlmN [Deltaproteobacteria bacterium]|nr:23S rRNA (adenine(2503)-C(2))-methyltransferase RlmN [Deltaproteobacteria bacterium]
MSAKVDLKGKTLKELEKLFVSSGKERFRARQIFRWIYEKLETDFSNMTDLSKSFRRELDEEFFVSRFIPEMERASQDGTVKFLFPLAGGEGIETVFIPDEERKTVCLSTQVGCRMGCVFCATQQGGFSRNLTSAEIINQVCFIDHFLRHKGERVTNVVFMGMGEPLDNIDELLKVIRILNSEFAFKIANKRITVSTCGLVPELKRLITECDASIAVSINAATDEMRDELMPVNRKYPMGELIRCVRELQPNRNRKVTMEYLLIKGVNDSPKDAVSLARLLSKCRVKVNLIPLNPTSANSFQCPDVEAIEIFREILVNKGIQTIIRERRGADIEAACGQLRGKMMRKGKILE